MLMKTSRSSVARIAGVLVVCVLLGGCQATPDKVMHRNFAQIHENASMRTEVSALLGSPQHTIGDTWMYTRPEQHLTVIIDFDAKGQVVRKQWVDGETGHWEDTND